MPPGAIRKARKKARPPGCTEREVERWRAGAVDRRIDAIAEEVPVAMVYNGTTFAVMMATPADIEDFALGFSLTEGVIAARAELTGVEVAQRLEGIEVRMTIAAPRAAAIAARTRSLEGRSSCGICGSRSLEDIVRAPEHVGARPVVGGVALATALGSMEALQALNAATGATHAAGWATLAGELVALREDVGRHNALDKLIGHLAGTGVDPAGGFALITSRASYEMVLKAAAARIAVLAAVSAPTALAVDLARSCGITLIAFARGSDGTVYANPERFDGQDFK